MVAQVVFSLTAANTFSSFIGCSSRWAAPTRAGSSTVEMPCFPPRWDCRGDDA